jgi:hypothetical protein
MTIFMIALATGVIAAIAIIASLGPVQSSDCYDDYDDGATVFGDWD